MHTSSSHHRFQGRPRGWIGLVVLCGFLAASAARGQVTNIIWKASFNGQLAIQQFNTQLNPSVRVAFFKSTDFLNMVLGGTTPSNSVLALNFSAAGGTTNYFLSIFDLVGRTNTLRLTTGETTAILRDKNAFTFTESLLLVPVAPTWGGGLIQFSGRSPTSHSTPTTVSATVDGYFTDTRPVDLNGTTGILVHASIQTIGNPVRVQPPVIP